jgi:hypothetical protein
MQEQPRCYVCRRVGTEKHLTMPGVYFCTEQGVWCWSVLNGLTPMSAESFFGLAAGPKRVNEDEELGPAHKRPAMPGAAAPVPDLKAEQAADDAETAYFTTYQAMMTAKRRAIAARDKVPAKPGEFETVEAARTRISNVQRRVADEQQLAFEEKVAKAYADIERPYFGVALTPDMQRDIDAKKGTKWNQLERERERELRLGHPIVVRPDPTPLRVRGFSLEEKRIIWQDQNIRQEHIIMVGKEFGPVPRTSTGFDSQAASPQEDPRMRAIRDKYRKRLSEIGMERAKSRKAQGSEVTAVTILPTGYQERAEENAVTEAYMREVREMLTVVCTRTGGCATMARK